MAQISLLDAFNDCMERIASGQSLESCLSLYPGYAAQLRPLIEVALSVRQLQPPTAELREDQALVWEQITRTLPLPVRRRRRSYYRLLLLAAVLLFIFMLSATWFLFTRPDLPSDDRQVLETLTPTVSPSPTAIPSTFTLTPSPTLIVTATVTPSPTLTVTATVTPSPTLTVTTTVSPTTTASPTPTQTVTLTATNAPTTAPTATFAPGCGAPLTQQDAANRVLAIYPNTTISSITQVVKFGGTLVWEVKTSHGIEVNIDVACGVILTIQQLNPPATSGTDANVNNNNSNSAPSGSSGSSSSNSNDNDDDNDDNSGSGGGDDNDDDD